ncbi:MAG: hypothetical protein K0S45_1926 [Nitrospira sp.]|nr:hypothetical protein [Nitrospira sp.]
MQVHEPTYEESLKLGWALFWRGVGSFALLIFGVNALILFLLPEMTRTSPSLWVALVPLALATLLCTFLVMPFVVRRLMLRPFRGFHVEFVRDEPPPR